MKFEVYSDKEILEEILLESSKYQNWNNILKHHSDVYLNMSQTDYDLEIALADESILFQYLQDTGGKEPIPNEQFFIDFEADNNIVEGKPLSAFFLKKDDAEINCLKEHFGLLFQNEKIDDDVLSEHFYWDFDKEFEYKDASDNEGWSYFLNSYMKVSNVLVLNDPYLFDNPELIEKEYVQTGSINLINFLNQILPSKLSVDYHLLIFTGNNKKDMSEAKAKSIYEFLCQELKKIRSFNIILELIVSKDTLHRRRAYSNYAIYKCDQGFDLFSERKKNYPKTDNDLAIDNIFTSIKSKGSSVQFFDLVSKTQKVKLSTVKALDNIKEAKVYRGERCHGLPPDYSIKNRLINHFP